MTIAKVEGIGVKWKALLVSCEHKLGKCVHCASGSWGLTWWQSHRALGNILENWTLAHPKLHNLMYGTITRMVVHVNTKAKVLHDTRQGIKLVGIWDSKLDCHACVNRVPTITQPSCKLRSSETGGDLFPGAVEAEADDAGIHFLLIGLEVRSVLVCGVSVRPSIYQLCKSNYQFVEHSESHRIRYLLDSTFY